MYAQYTRLVVILSNCKVFKNYVNVTEKESEKKSASVQYNEDIWDLWMIEVSL